MGICNSAQNRRTFKDSLFMVFDGGDMQRIPVEFDLQKQYEPKHDPEKPPPKQHGDKYYVLGALIGVIVGGIIGCLLSRFGGLLMFNIIAGAMVGGVTGVIVGSLLRKHRFNKESSGKEV